MSTYFIGDIHGCYKNLKNMLDYVNFDPAIDSLFLTGDLVYRGPNSLEVLRLMKNLKKNACTVLGNHDLNLIKTYFCRKNKKNNDYFNSILNASDIDDLINWLRFQPILYINENKKILMSHAGINPNWNINQAQLYAQEIENILIGNQPDLLFLDLYQKKLQKINNDINIDKLKKIQENIIFFTKMRYIDSNGILDLQYKGIPEYAPKNIKPWFDINSNIVNSGYNVIFGHWASLYNTKIPNGFYGLDSGCCWGGYLTLLKWENKKIIRKSCSSIS